MKNTAPYIIAALLHLIDKAFKAIEKARGL